MTRTSFDALVARLAASPTTFSERELLESSHWRLGEDARLREDPRFRKTPWGRWMLAVDLLANDAVYHWLHAEQHGSAALDAALGHTAKVFGRRCVFCAEDPRFVLRGDEVHLAASELSRQPVVEDEVGELEKYRTHLPLHSLRAVAASEPAGQWGQQAQDQVIEPRGWVRVALPGRTLNDRMFIAAIEGHSMDDGRSGLVDGGYAVFELWPSGTRQNLSVLVRGAFSDPETGSYAVKKYVADQRNVEGRHGKISLVSLNPDKERYPDIVLEPESDDDIAIVAKVVQALSPVDYERRPKPRRRAGRRELTAEAQDARLARRVASFFDGTVSEADDEDPHAAATGWQARMTCLDVAAGGLQLEIGPLGGLPGFVKKLRVVGTGWDAIVLAANAKLRPTRTSVRPGTGPWRWEAVGFEDEEDLGFEQLALDALEAETATIFRVDASDVGQRIKSTTLALGQVYRLLLPPKLGEGLGTELDDGWRIWSLDFSVPPSPATRQALSALGLELSEAWPRLDWALAPPSAWRVNARGANYPVFEAGTELFVRAGGISMEGGDEVVLFLHGPSGIKQLPLSASAILSLGRPAPGRWACELVHSRTSIPSASLLFEVIENATEHVTASWSVAAPDGVTSLEVTVPPGWPVSLRWRGVAAHEETLGTLYGTEDRGLPVENLTLIVEDRAARARIADLVIDFGELGGRCIPHDGRIPLKQVREGLILLWNQRKGLVKNRAGAWLQLLPTWFQPVTKLFGYDLDPLALPTQDDAPHDLAVWLLTLDERIEENIKRLGVRILILTTDLDAMLHTHREWIDKACTDAKVRDAIVTDGVCWTTHRKGALQLRPEVWNLDQAIEDDSIEEMLVDLAEGL